MLRDGVQGAVSITEPQLKKWLEHIDKVFSDPKVSARDLASLFGKIISMSAVLGNLSRTGILLHHWTGIVLSSLNSGMILFVVSIPGIYLAAILPLFQFTQTLAMSLAAVIFLGNIFSPIECSRTQNERRVLRIMNWPISYLF